MRRLVSVLSVLLLTACGGGVHLQPPPCPKAYTVPAVHLVTVYIEVPTPPISPSNIPLQPNRAQTTPDAGVNAVAGAVAGELILWRSYGEQVEDILSVCSRK